jgi:hypothetical protein
MAGKMGTCPKCGRTMRVPTEAAGAAAPPAAPVAGEKVVRAETRPAAEAVMPEGASHVSEATAAGETAGEPPLYPVNIRWPRSSTAPLIISVAGLLVIGAVVVGAVVWSAAERKRETERRTEEERGKVQTYVNPKYNYHLEIPSGWQTAGESTPEKLVLRGTNDSAEISIEVLQGVESINGLLNSLGTEAAKENGFTMEKDWGRDSSVTFKPWQMTYLVGSGGDRRRVIVRAFQAGDNWMAVIFRAPLADYQRMENQFSVFYSKIVLP